MGEKTHKDVELGELGVTTRVLDVNKENDLGELGVDSSVKENKNTDIKSGGKNEIY